MLCRFKTGAVKGSFWENQERPHKKPCLRGKECSDCAETRLPRNAEMQKCKKAARMGRRSF